MRAVCELCAAVGERGALGPRRVAMYDSGRIGCAIGPESCGNCAARRMRTSSIRFTASDVMSDEKCWSRKTVSPSFSVSWNQSRHVTRLPDQLWKYSWPITLSMRS